MPSAPPLSDRALKHGRNVMATSGVIVVLAWVPEIDVEKFKPFGFEISSGGALSIWGVLCAVLVYYFASFIFDSCIDIPDPVAGIGVTEWRISARPGSKRAGRSACQSSKSSSVGLRTGIAGSPETDPACCALS